ncbi:MAG: hypothetical protein PHQ60_15745 [Sideroxydans sp.]|nr:hypothetical protein [Sideroxydans sp.]
MSPEELRPAIDAAVQTFPAVSAALMFAIAQKESGYQNVQNYGGYPAYGPWQVVSSEAIEGRPTGEELLSDIYLSAEWAARILDGALTRERGDLERAMWRYSGGHAWDSYELYLERYWKPLSKMLAEWTKTLKQEEALTDFSRYPRPAGDTGAGVHLGANASFPLGENQGSHVADYMGEPVGGKWLETCLGLKAMGLTWVKVLTTDDSALACLPTILYAGLMPVVRVIWPRPGVVLYSEKQLWALGRMAALGVRYIEDDNERNLVAEWPEGGWPGEAMPFDDLAAAWFTRATMVAAHGMYFAIPPLAPGGDYDDIRFLRNWCRAVKKIGGAVDLLRHWGWISVHTAALNHPLSYPYDTVNQAEHPGAILADDSNCWLKWRRVHEVVNEELGLELPVLSTEGGAWPGSREDDRYPELTVEEASLRQYRMLKAMETAPSYFLANMPWLYANREYGNHAAHFERQAWIRWPGLRNEKGEVMVPESEPAVLPVVDMLKQDPVRERTSGGTVPPAPEPPDETPESALEAAIGAALQGHIIPLYPDAAFARDADARGYVVASDEVTLVLEGAEYLAQAWRDPDRPDEQQIVYSPAGQYNTDRRWFSRAN